MAAVASAALWRRIVLPFLVLLLVLPVVVGCAPPSAAPGPPPPTSSASISAAPLYRQAVARYARRDFAGALSVLNSLQSVPPYRDNPAAQSFLERQRRLCRQALSGRSAAGRSSAASPPAPVSHVSASADCGPRALLLVCREMGVTAVDLETLRKAAGTKASGTSLEGLARAAKGMGLKAKGVQMDRQALAQLSSPALAWVDGNHYIAVLSVSGDAASVHDPNTPQKEEMTLDDLLRRSGGVLLTLQH